MKRIVIALLIVSTLLVGCSEVVPTTTKAPKTDAETTMPTKTETPSDSPTPSQTHSPSTPTPTPSPTFTGLVDIDSAADFPQNINKLKNTFDGEEIQIVVCGGDYAARSISVDKASQDPVDIAIDKRNAAVEDYLGVKITAKETVSMQGMQKYLRDQLNAPDGELDIVGVNQYFDVGMMLSNDKNPFISYNQLTEKGENHVNINSPYWSDDCYYALDWKDNAFWLTGDLSLTWLSHTYVSFVNEKIWNEYKSEIKEQTGYEDIHEVVKNGKWTIELIMSLNEIVHKNNDGNESTVSYQDQHGIVLYNKNASINNTVADALFSASHVTITDYDSKSGSREPSMNYYNNNLKTYCNTIYDLYSKSKSCIIDFDSTSEKGSVGGVFSMGNTLVGLGTLADVEEYLLEMKDEYSILPLPMLNEDQKGYSTTTVNNVNQFGISCTTSNASAATATLELLGYLTYKTVTPVYYDKVTRGGFSQNQGDNNDSEMIEIIRNSIYYDFAVLRSKDLSVNTEGDVLWYFRNNFANKNLYQLGRGQSATWENRLMNLIDKLNSRTGN